jgi:hypothetical protein
MMRSGHRRRNCLLAQGDGGLGPAGPVGVAGPGGSLGTAVPTPPGDVDRARIEAGSAKRAALIAAAMTAPAAAFALSLRIETRCNKGITEPVIVERAAAFELHR